MSALTLLDNPGTDYAFAQVHEIPQTTKVSDVLYIYRNPVEVIYSRMAVREQTHRAPWGLDVLCIYLRNHLNRHLLRGAIPVKFERLLDPTVGVAEFKKVLGWMGRQWNESRYSESISKVTIQALADRATGNLQHYFHTDMMSADYKDGREEFRKIRGEEVMSKVITSDLRPFFQ